MRLFLILPLLVAVLAITLLAPAAAAVCLPWDTIRAQLHDSFGEVPLWTGPRETGDQITILAAPGGTTWTAVVLRPDGAACLAAAGTSWAAPLPVPPGERG